MGEVVNLNRRRKAQARAAAQQLAAANRAAHGRTKVARTQDETDNLRRDALLDGAKIEP